MDDQTSLSKEPGRVIYRNLSLRTIMAVSFGAVFVITVLLSHLMMTYGVPFTSYGGSYAYQRKAVLEDLGIIADMNKDRVIQGIKDIRSHVTDLARAKPIQALILPLCETLKQDSSRGREGGALRTDLFGTRTYSALLERLHGAMNAQKAFNKIQIVDAQSRIILASTDETETGTNAPDEPIIRKALNISDHTWVVVERTSSSKMPHPLVFAAVTSPMHGEDADEFRAIFLVYVDAETLLRPSLLVPGKLGQTGEIVLVDHSFNPVITLQHSWPGGVTPSLPSDQTIAEPAIRAVMGENDIKGALDYRGARVLAAYRHIKIAPDLLLGLVVKQDEAEALRPVDHRIAISFLVALIGLLVGGIIAVLVADRISKPITALTRTASAVENGDFSVRANRSVLPEVDVLARSFNSMLERIQHWREDLESRVHERTAELMELNEDLEIEVSKRKQTEQSLFEKDATLLEAQRIANLGNWDWNISKGTLECSEEMYRIFGLPAENFDPTYETLMERVHPDDRVAVQKAVDDALADRFPFSAEYRIVLPDTQIKFVHARGEVTFDEKHRPVRMLGTVHDVTEIRQAEQKTKGQSNFLATILESLDHPFFVVDPSDHSIVLANSASGFVVGTQQENCYGIPPCSQTSWSVGEGSCPFQAIVKTRKSLIFDHAYYDKDGAYKAVEIHCHPVFDSNGDVSQVIHYTVDISERKRAEEALKDSEQRFRRLSEASFEGIVISRDGVILDTNESFARMTGYDFSELIGRNMIALSTEKFRDIIAENVFSNREESYEAELLGKNGSVIPVTMRGRSATYKGSTARVASIRDISAQKEAEQENENLRSQLFQSQKMEAIGTLAGGIAHDFNNILFAVIGYTELAIQRLPEDDKLLSYLEKVFQAGNRAKDLVQQILTFSRHSEQELALLQVGPITKEALKFLRASIPTTIEIRHSIQTNLGMIKADPTQIHQVLMNLCANAAHAMREKGGVLNVELSNVDIDSTFIQKDPELVPGPYIRLSVSDTGHGMTPETLNRIFEPYFTTKPVGEGTGLGLAVVHGIIKKMGATIRVSSERGKGSTFEVFFPRISKEEIVEGVGESITIPRGHERILWVDDEPDVVDIGKGLLERLGYKIQIRTSSVDALEFFRVGPREFDLVITDMAMPLMTGTELAKKILSIRPDIPIIMCTGFSDILSEESAKGLGISALIMKPIISHELAQQVRLALDVSNISSTSLRRNGVEHE